MREVFARKPACPPQFVQNFQSLNLSVPPPLGPDQSLAPHHMSGLLLLLISQVSFPVQAPGHASRQARSLAASVPPLAMTMTA